MIHKGLECRGCIGEAKRHDNELVVAIMGAECGFWNILFIHTNLMITGAEIQLGEESGSMKLVKELINNRDGETVLNSGSVELAVVHTKAPRALFLAYKENQRGIRAATIANEAGGQHVLHLLI